MTSTDTTEAHSRPSYSLWQLIIYMLKLGTWGFGGPVALAGYMNRDLVEKYRWITESDYKEGLALAQMAPGPMAAQLAIYLGYVPLLLSREGVKSTSFFFPVDDMFFFDSKRNLRSNSRHSPN